MKTKEYQRQIRELHRIFNGKPPEWLVNKVTEHYERTKDNDHSKLGDSVFNKEE